MWRVRRRLDLRRGAAIVAGARLVGAGLAGSWAIGLLILVGQASGEVSGPSTIIALVIAAITALLTALCRGELDATRRSLLATQLRHGRRRRRHLTEDFPAFFTMWLGLLANMTALAACSRGLSTSMDYISGGRTQHWVQAKMGPLPSFLGGCLPDLMALGVTIVPTVLFMLGLEHSTALRVLLNISLTATIVFFLTIGSMQTDTSNWTGHNFLAAGWTGLLTGAAICSFGFLGFVGVMSQSCMQSQGRRLRLAAAGTTLLIMFLSYCAVAVVVSMMVHFRALNGSPVPLLRVFEIRDVDWARLVMATFSIIGLALAVLEVCTPLHALVVCLGGEEWRVLPRALSREHSSTGTPILAILVAGLPASLLACICPLWLLVKIMCVGPLVDHAVIAAAVVQRRYQPQPSVMTKTASDKGVKYHRLTQNSTSVFYPHDDCDECDEDDTEVEVRKQHKLTVRCLKSGLDFLPAAIRQHVSSGPNQQYYTSLSSPCSVRSNIIDTQTNLSNPTISSESVNVTYMDPDNISLVQEGITKNEMNHGISNGTIVTSLSYDSMTQGQMDTRCMTNGSVTSLRSIESMIMDQSELEIKNGSISSIKPPNSVSQVENDTKALNNDSIISSKSLLSMANHNFVGSIKSLCSVNDGELDSNKIMCNGSVKSSRTPVIYSERNFIVGDGDEELLVAGSNCDTISASISVSVQNNGTKPCSCEGTILCKSCKDDHRKTKNTNIGSDTDENDATLSSASASDGEADDSDSSTTDIDAIVAEYKERIKVATTLTGVQPVVCEPTAATGRRVTICLAGIMVCISVLGIATVLPEPVSLWCGSLGFAGTLFLLAVIAHQPQNRQDVEVRVLLVPWLPAAVVLINVILCLQLMVTVWPAALIWIVTGVLLYWQKRGWRRCRNRPGVGGGGSSRRERIRLHAPPRHPTVSTLIPSHRCLPDDRVRRLTQVDTILISR